MRTWSISARTRVRRGSVAERRKRAKRFASLPREEPGKTANKSAHAKNGDGEPCVPYPVDEVGFQAAQAIKQTGQGAAWMIAIWITVVTLVGSVAGMWWISRKVMNQKTRASHGSSAAGPREVRVEGSQGTHVVRKNALGEESCTCRSFLDHGSKRRHILAARSQWATDGDAPDPDGTVVRGWSAGHGGSYPKPGENRPHSKQPYQALQDIGTPESSVKQVRGDQMPVTPQIAMSVSCLHDLVNKAKSLGMSASSDQVVQRGLRRGWTEEGAAKHAG